MVSVGVLPTAEDPRQFPVSSALIDQGFTVVDISRESFDNDPAHSGDSLVRGKLEL